MIDAKDHCYRKVSLNFVMNQSIARIQIRLQSTCERQTTQHMTDIHILGDRKKQRGTNFLFENRTEYREKKAGNGSTVRRAAAAGSS